MNIASKLLEYYRENYSDFRKAREEAFLNLIVGTKGKILDVLRDTIGEDATLQALANELV